MEIKIINEIRDEIKIFRSIEEFDLYYQKNKETMDKLTTNYLNKIYKIELPNGAVYRITKKNCGTGKGKTTSGDIFLKKVVQKTEEQPLWEIANENIKIEITELRQKNVDLQNKLQAAESKLDKITETVNILA